MTFPSTHSVGCALETVFMFGSSGHQITRTIVRTYEIVVMRGCLAKIMQHMRGTLGKDGTDGPHHGQTASFGSIPQPRQTLVHPGRSIIIAHIDHNEILAFCQLAVSTYETAADKLFTFHPLLGIGLLQWEMLPERGIRHGAIANGIGILKGIVMTYELRELPFCGHIFMQTASTTGIFVCPCRKTAYVTHLFSLSQTICLGEKFA